MKAAKFAFLAINLLPCVHALTSISIWSLDIYSIQRSCVRNAIDYLPLDVGCRDSGNECFCREDTTPKATSRLSSTVSRDCSSNAVDVSSAIIVYTSYCNGAMGQNIVPATTAPNDTPTLVTSASAIETQTTTSIRTYNTYTMVTATPINPSNTAATFTARYTGPTFDNQADRPSHPILLSIAVPWGIACVSLITLWLSIML